MLGVAATAEHVPVSPFLTFLAEIVSFKIYQHLNLIKLVFSFIRHNSSSPEVYSKLQAFGYLSII